MFTGRFPHELSTDYLTPLDGTFPTLAEVLAAHEYVTAGFVANTAYGSQEFGLSRGFAHYEDYPVSLGQVVLSSSLGRAVSNNAHVRQLVGYHDTLNRKPAATLNRDFLDWLSNQERRPFFAFLNYFDAHEPYLAPAPFDMMFGPQGARDPFVYQTNLVGHANQRELHARDPQPDLDAYESSIAYLDHHLGLLFDELERRGALENTLVMITADHGEEFGEHGVFMHGYSLYLPALHVPLLVSFPARVPAGGRVSAPVSLRDIPATVLDLLALRDGPFPGRSLAECWAGGHSSDRSSADAILSEAGPAIGSPAWYPVAKGDLKSMVIDQHHYIRNGDGREELYDVERDPWERQDLADSEAGRAQLARCRMSLDALLS